MMQSHANAPEQVIREAMRLYPLDLVARIDWLTEQAYASTSEADRHAILMAVRQIRGGE
jgi:hypothetical protein